MVKKDTEEQSKNRIENANLVRLVKAYRTYGHLEADLDPLGLLTRRFGSLSSLFPSLSSFFPSLLPDILGPFFDL